MIPQPDPRTAAGRLGAGPRVLVIQDSPARTVGLKAWLEGEGFDIHTAHTVDDARASLESNPFDLVITDLVLPDGSGHDVCRYVKSTRGAASPPVILTAAFETPWELIRGLESGASSYLRKPLQKRRFLGRIRSVLDAADRQFQGDAVRIISRGREFQVDAGRAHVVEYLVSCLEDALAAREAPWAGRPGDRDLTEEHVFVRGALDALASHVAIVDARGRIVFVNERWREFDAAHGDDAVRGRIGDDYLAKLEEARSVYRTRFAGEALRGIRAVQAGRENVAAVRYECDAGGEARWFEMQVTRFAHGSEPHAVIAHTDVTSRALSEQRVRASEEEYRSLVEDAPLAILRSTREGRILAFNRAFMELLGYDRTEELAGLDLGRDVYANPGDRHALVAKASAGELSRAQATWKRRDGGHLTVALSVRAIRGLDGEVEAFESVADDMTEGLRLADQLRQAQKMELVGQLSGGVAHDFNNLLSVVLTNAELLTAQLSDEGREFSQELSEIRRAGRRGAEMVQRLMGFSRKARLRPEPMDLRSAVHDTVTMFGPLLSEGIEIRIAEADAGLWVLADAGALEQMLLNLLTNARDAVRGSGLITIRLGEGGPSRTVARPAEGSGEEGFAWIEISDDGIGMDEETLAQIFDPFFTTKGSGEGTGLGMSMIRDLVGQHGGSVEVESEPGIGTTFRLFLSQVEPPASRPQAPVAEEAVGGTETILVVEDDRSVLRAAKRILERAGYTAVTAGSGMEARSIMEERGSEIDLVVTDIVMPGMRGDQLVREMRARGFAVPVLLSSGHSDERDLPADLISQDGVGILFKPWSICELLAGVREALDRDIETGDA